MKKEILARGLVALFVLIAVAIPIGGRWWASRNQPASIEMHARMAENGGWSIATIQATVGQPIHLHITSDDVVHGFAIGKSNQPSLEILPGEFVDTTLIFDQPGKYTYYCDRWCGPNHWRMRGTIEVTAPAGSPAQPIPPDPQPLFLQLGIDIDSPQPAQITPAGTASAERGTQYASLLPTYATKRDTYLANSPAVLWMRLRAETTLANLNDQDVWDAVAWVWEQQTTPGALADAHNLYNTNCAACHGEKGQGNGVMVRGLPVWKPGSQASRDMATPSSGNGLVSPPDFTDPKNLLGASPALLEGKIIRGGMGTGMPYWGPIFTTQQIHALVSYLYTFAWGLTGLQVK
jgi:mono/diheme cytochrome c family protein/plastocyanin